MMVWAGLGALLIILIWGDLANRLLLKNLTGAVRMSLGWLLGSGLVSWGLFIGLWAGLSLLRAVMFLSLTGSLLWLLWIGLEWIRTKPAEIKPKLAPHRSVDLASETEPNEARGLQSRLPPPWRLIFSVILVIQLGSVAFAALVSPLVAWDAWVNWASKANAIVIDQTLSPTLVNDPARWPTNPDYPLMLPLLEAWVYAWVGRIHEPLAGLIPLAFYAALLLLFYQAVRQTVSSPAALGFTVLLATVPRLERMGHVGLADLPMATLVLAAFLLLLYDYNSAFDRQNGTPGAALALLAGFLPWLKNEGWLWLGLISVTWLVARGRQARLEHRGGQRVWREGLRYFAITALIAGAWPLFLAINGTDRFTFLPLTAETLIANWPRLFSIVPAMLSRLLNPYWNFIWLFAGLTVLVRRKKSWRAPLGWLILPIGGFLVLISMTFVFSRFDPYLDHLNNSAERLILQATPLALWWLAGQSVAVGWVKPAVSEIK